MWLCARRKATKPVGEAPRQSSLKNAEVLFYGPAWNRTPDLLIVPINNDGTRVDSGV